MNNEKTKGGLEALAGDVPPLPAKASSPPPYLQILFLHYSLFIIHYPLSIIHYPLSLSLSIIHYPLSIISYDHAI
jgi:hypothetical protein